MRLHEDCTMESVYGETDRICSIYMRKCVYAATMRNLHLRNLANGSIIFKLMFQK
jgi:hypothetical protein